LSTYGYSINARSSVRQRALKDAIEQTQNGVNVVYDRLRYLYEKYKKERNQELISALLTDLQYVDELNEKATTKQTRTVQREESKQRLKEKIDTRRLSIHHHHQQQPQNRRKSFR
jgi:hypothetical protein